MRAAVVVACGAMFVSAAHAQTATPSSVPPPPDIADECKGELAKLADEQAGQSKRTPQEIQLHLKVAQRRVDECVERARHRVAAIQSYDAALPTMQLTAKESDACKAPLAALADERAGTRKAPLPVVEFHIKLAQRKVDECVERVRYAASVDAYYDTRPKVALTAEQAAACKLWLDNLEVRHRGIRGARPVSQEVQEAAYQHEEVDIKKCVTEYDQKVALAQAAAELQARTEAHSRDVKWMRPAMSARICSEKAEREGATDEIATEKRYARLGGVVSLRNLYDQQNLARLADDDIAVARAALKALKTTPLACSSAPVQQIFECMKWKSDREEWESEHDEKIPPGPCDAQDMQDLMVLFSAVHGTE